MRPRILLVEDSTNTALDLKESLEEMGYQVPFMASSGEEAIELVKKEEISLVLMDTLLKGELDGIETAATIRGHLGIPVIFMTADSDGDTFAKAKIAEPYGFITKPYVKENLQHVIELALYKRDLGLTLKERERRLNTLISNLQGMVYRCENDRAYTMEYVSQGSLNLTGYRAKDLMDRKVSFNELIHPDDRRKVSESIEKALEEKRHFTITYRIYTNSGEMKWVWERGLGVIEPFSERVLLEGFITDITEQKKIEERLSANKKKIELLHRVAIEMETLHDEEEVYHLVTKSAEEILKFSICCLDMIEGDRLVVKSVSSGSPPDGYRASSPIDQGLAGKTIITGRSYLIKDLLDMEEEGAEPVLSEYRSAISVPIGDIGVFQVISTQIDAFDEEDLNMVELLISHTTAAIERIRTAKEIKYVSFHDKLTGLYNRFFFEEEMKRLDTERNLPLSIIIGDVNGLKLVNDAFDHQQGDSLLQDIARVIKEVCRSEDIVCRWGGDEYAIILSSTGLESTQSISRRIMEACSLKERRPVPLSISLGCATKTHMGQSLNDTLKRAEEDMYKNKMKEGRLARDTIISSLQRDLAKRSRESEEHISSVQRIVVKIGESLGFSKARLEDLLLLASVHDIGMIAIDREILQKSSCLTLEELEEIKKHPEVGYRIALTCSNLAPLADAILAHHEHWDGNGYPRGLKGEEIPLISRILSIADSLSVMVEGSYYREALSFDEALEELRRYSGTQFDPRLVDFFKYTISSFKE